MTRACLSLSGWSLMPALMAGLLASCPVRAGSETAGTPEPPPPVLHTAGERAVLDDYARRIQEAIQPGDVRRACNSPTGSYAAGETITVCGEAPGQNRYRVPREVAVSPKEEDMMSPVRRGRAIMSAGGGPVGNAADLGGTGFNPLLFGIMAFKAAEALIENATEE